MTKNLKPRLLEEVVRRKLRGIGAVLIEGPRGCGKTTLAGAVAKSGVDLSDPELQARRLELDAPTGYYLKGRAPRMLDEWQRLPAVWDAMRLEVDHRRKPGQFLLTSSAALADGGLIFHSGTGRVAWIRLRPLSLWESGDSNGRVSLSGLLEGRFEPCRGRLGLEDVAWLACRGGWPEVIGLEKAEALERVAARYRAATSEDLVWFDGVKRTAANVRVLMRTCARHQGKTISVPKLRAAMAVESRGESVVTAKTLFDYLNALRKTFIMEDLPAWQPALRSRSAVRLTDARYLTDPSLAAAALGMGPRELAQDSVALSGLFKTLCLRDLRVYAESWDGRVSHFRDRNGLACDAVIERRGGACGLIAIRLGSGEAVELASRELKKLASKIDDERMSKPSFLMVLTAVGEWAYQRTDGVCVVPIGCLRP